MGRSGMALGVTAQRDCREERKEGLLCSVEEGCELFPGQKEKMDEGDAS
jgi:hypothetical protein